MPHLSFALSGPLGGDPATSQPAVVGHVQAALDRLVEQYKGKPVIQAILTACAEQSQAREVVHVQMQDLLSIDNSVGVQLDNIGARVGEPRQGFPDVVYRLHLKARILLNTGSGTVPDILALFVQLVGTTPLLTLTEYFPAALVLKIGTLAVDPTLAPYLVNFLAKARVGGVRGILEYLNASPAASFTFAGGGGLGFNSGIFASAKEA